MMLDLVALDHEVTRHYLVASLRRILERRVKSQEKKLVQESWKLPQTKE